MVGVLVRWVGGGLGGARWDGVVGLADIIVASPPPLRLPPSPHPAICPHSVDMRAIEGTIQRLIGSGLDPKLENNPYLCFVYTSFQVRGGG